MSAVLSLRDARDERQVGGKARNLARLLALGAPVPDGIVLTRPALDAWLGARRGAAGGAVQASAPPTVLREAFAAMDGDLRPGEALAVRSSALGEDGERASFAGQLDTILHVRGVEDLHRAVAVCWASQWSERVVAYQAARGVRLDGMGIIVQRQVPARVSGVLFTNDPGTPGALPDDLLIEYGEGLGEALVSGRIDPGRLIVSRHDLSLREIVKPGTSVEVSGQLTAVLTPRRILDLARLALRLECGLGGAQDIEWAIGEDGRLWILQARPITTHRAPRDPRFEALWSNANVSENFPRPISPFLYSIAALGYANYFRNLGAAFGVSRRRLAAMDRPLGRIIGVHGARMYYNLTNIHAVLRLAPFGDLLASAFNEFVGAGEMATAPREAVGWRDRGGRVGRTLEIVRIAVQTARQYLFLARRIRVFERTADDFAARTDAKALGDRDLADLLRDLDTFVDIRANRWKDASLADAASMVCYALLQRALAWAGAERGLHTRLLKALPDLPSSVPPIELWRLSRRIRSNETLRALFTQPAGDVLNAIERDRQHAPFKQAFERYLDQWGFRSSEELMLTVPSLREDPRPVIELLRSYVSMDGELPEQTIAQQAAQRTAETSRLLRRLLVRAPLKAALVAVLLRWTQRAVVYRERARLKQALLYSCCRRVALAIGDCFVRAGWLRERDDVFMLTWQEIAELGSGHAMFPNGVAALVSLRVREHASLSAMHPPDTIRLPYGGYVPHDDVAGPRHLPPEAAAETSAGTSPRLAGAGACGGHVTARAAVLAEIGESHRLRRGDVLVTRQTDPGWAPVFCLISGLVIERGGMLSHGAILAREFGLPCVVGVQDATTRIAHGSLVTVDGDRGACMIVDPTNRASSMPLVEEGRAS